MSENTLEAAAEECWKLAIGSDPSPDLLATLENAGLSKQSLLQHLQSGLDKGCTIEQQMVMVREKIAELEISHPAGRMNRRLH